MGILSNKCWQPLPKPVGRTASIIANQDIFKIVHKATKFARSEELLKLLSQNSNDPKNKSKKIQKA